MAYFSNGSEGSYFEQECSMCKFGQLACPITCVQTEYNYDAVNNKVASDILDHLVSDDGECKMLRAFEGDLKLNG